MAGAKPHPPYPGRSSSRAPSCSPISIASSHGLLAAIPFVSTPPCSSAIGARTSPTVDGHGVMVPWTQGLRTNACTVLLVQVSPSRPEGHVLLRAFLGSAATRGVLASTDGELAQIVREEAGTLLVCGRAGSRPVYRWPAARRRWRWGTSIASRASRRGWPAGRACFSPGRGCAARAFARLHCRRRSAAAVTRALLSADMPSEGSSGQGEGADLPVSVGERGGLSWTAKSTRARVHGRLVDEDLGAVAVRLLPLRPSPCQ